MSYTVRSTTTRNGFRSHVATTTNHALYCALYEAALEVDIEPDYGTTEGGAYWVEFLCSDAECDEAIEAALEVAAYGMAVAA